MPKYFIISVLLLPLVALASFSDVYPGNPHKEAIDYLKLQEIVKGYDDGSFRSHASINRAEFTKILVGSQFTVDEIDDCVLSQMPFEDVEVATWFAPYVCKAHAEGLVSGYEDGTFKPGNDIKVPEALKMVAKAFMKDVSWAVLDPWYRQFVEYLAEVRAIPVEIESINSDLTRGQMAELIHRLRLDIDDKASHSFESLHGTGNPFPADEAQSFRQDFIELGLQTNTANSLIPIDDILAGGPPKDGIPALNNPSYVSVSDITWLENDSRGVLLKLNGEVLFYPYDVLYWHEIVNDRVGSTDFSVTFCPLCGSSIVYDRKVGDQIYDFGVSGKLWQSNLLMYDTKTESLWSQIEGKAMVGELAGQTLEVIPSDIIFYEEVKDRYPKAKILGRDTGYNRAYGTNPYGTYESDDLLIFPVDSQDESFQIKTLFVAGTYKNINFGLHRKNLLEVGNARFNIGGESLVAQVEKDRTIVVTNPSGQRIPTYTTMWFSWANHHKDLDAVIWSNNN